MKAIAAALLVLSCHLLAPLASAQPVERDTNWLKSNQTYRAVFCGDPGHEEASKDYSEAMNAALRLAQTQGKTTEQSIRTWRQEFCGARTSAAPASGTPKLDGSKQ